MHSRWITADTLEPRSSCSRCRRPVVTCYCAHLTSILTRTRIVVLQHPREQHKAIGTARMATLCLPRAEIAVGVDFEQNARVRALVSDPLAPAVLLYPTSDARDLRSAPFEGPVTLVVLDGTWPQAKKLLRANPWLHALPRVAFVPDRPSEYRIRREPRESYVSTIEALVQTLCVLEGESAVSSRFAAMLSPFRAMVDTQIGYVGSSPTPRRRKHRRHRADAASRLPQRLCDPRLVCMIGEANAWSHDPVLGGPPYPHELVHLSALRLDPEAHFERLIAPRAPLAASPIKHSGLTVRQLAEGIDVAELRAAWAAFIAADDVLCIWGHYALDLMRREALSIPEHVIDLRKVVGDFLKTRPGSAEQFIERLELEWTPLGSGRGGRRLGMLAAVTRRLAMTARRGRRPA
jgi:DTW domain-containing protein